MATRLAKAEGTYKASAKFIHMSPYKVREVMTLIRGMHVDEARRILAFTPKAGARAVSKVLESAIANAEHDYQVPQDQLFVRLAYADEGLTIKRFRARAQGRGFRIRKRTCHVHLELERRIPEFTQSRAAGGSRSGRLRASLGRPPQAGGKPARAAGSKAAGTGGASTKAASTKATSTRAAGGKADAESTPATKAQASPASKTESAGGKPAKPRSKGGSAGKKEA
jgi:large subunit ribosomal protein L22